MIQETDIQRVLFIVVGLSILRKDIAFPSDASPDGWIAFRKHFRDSLDLTVDAPRVNPGRFRIGVIRQSGKSRVSAPMANSQSAKLSFYVVSDAQSLK